MDIFIGLIIIAFGIYVAISVVRFFGRDIIRKTPLKAKYRYRKKSSIITPTENVFYMHLMKIVGEEFIAIPQAHLSSFLNHRIEGQNWKSAFFMINGKSIDFIICRKKTMEPVVGIELDDDSHTFKKRMERDQFVESVMQGAGIKLVRFKAGEWNDEQAIFDKIKAAFTQINP